MYSLKKSYKFHRIPDTPFSVIAKVYDFLGQPLLYDGIENLNYEWVFMNFNLK